MSDRAQGRAYIQLVKHCFAAGNLSTVNQLLADTDFAELSNHSIVGLIRTTCRARGNLPAWQNAYEFATAELIKRGGDPAKVFVGLPPIMAEAANPRAAVIAEVVAKLQGLYDNAGPFSQKHYAACIDAVKGLK